MLSDLLLVIASCGAPHHGNWRLCPHDLDQGGEPLPRQQGIIGYDLEAKFRALTQGDLPVLEYAQRLKDLVDGLADLDEPVGDSTLLLALFRGVNEPLRNMASIYKTKDPLPTFLQA